ncbi:LytR family transcriptional regulator, partial [Nocardioides hankookensis]
MNDRPRGDGEPAEGTPEYHWLYGGGADTPPAPTPQSGSPREPRPDETRMMPAMARPTNEPARAGTP